MDAHFESLLELTTANYKDYAKGNVLFERGSTHARGVASYTWTSRLRLVAM